MKRIEQMKEIILRMITLCIVCAVAAFFSPDLAGTILAGITITLACIAGALCIGGLVYIMINGRYSAD